MHLIPSPHLEHIFESDQGFCQLYPVNIQHLDKLHSSPLYIINKAAKFLSANEGAKILDIGSGTGKFCLAGAFYYPSTIFYGVEQRQYLIDYAQAAKEKLGCNNVEFICKNFTQMDLEYFDGFYFYNSFFENLSGSDKIDDSIDYSAELYHYYSNYLNRKLSIMPTGTKVVTYCTWDDEIPPGYQMIESHANSLLKFWIKN